MMRARLVLLTLVLVTSRAAAQASEFGTRALGLPVLPLSARAQGMGGGIAMFDPDNPLNPAAIWLTQRGTATFSVPATVAATAPESVVNTASATLPAGVTDPAPANNAVAAQNAGGDRLGVNLPCAD